jgi:hypothetical protein
MGLEITPNYGQREAGIKQRLLMAQMLNQNAQDMQQNPNQMVGNKVVPISPFAAIANALSRVVSSYQGAKAQTEQGQLDDEKRNYLVKALSGGGQITPEIIANAGGDSDDLIKMALVNRQVQGTPGSAFVPPGSKPFKDEITGLTGYIAPDGSRIFPHGGLTEYQERQTNPEKRFNLSQAGQAGKESATVHEGQTLEGPVYQTGKELSPGLNNLEGKIKPPITPNQPQAEKPISFSQELINQAANIVFGPVGQQMVKRGFTQEQANLLEPVLKHLADQSQYPQQGQSSQRPHLISPAEKDRSLIPGRLEQKQGELNLENQNKLNLESQELLKKDPVIKESFNLSINKINEFENLLNKYSKEVGKNELLNNNPVYKFRSALGADTTISDMDSMAQDFVNTQIKALSAAGLSPSRLMDTKAEAERFISSVVGTGNSQAKLNAIKRYKETVISEMRALEEQRKTAAQRLGVEYQPLVNIPKIEQKQDEQKQGEQKPATNRIHYDENGNRVK